MQLAEASIAKIMAESRGDASEAFAQALQEKVGALLLLSQQEERHLHEENVNAALQQKVDELQRNILQVTNEKVRTLMELAQLRQEYQSLRDKMSGTREEESTGNSGRIVISNEKDGRLKNMWKKSYINRWIDPSSRGGSHLNTEADYASNIEYSRFGILHLHCLIVLGSFCDKSLLFWQNESRICSYKREPGKHGALDDFNPQAPSSALEGKGIK
jgi:hypothetical protein